MQNLDIPGVAVQCLDNPSINQKLFQEIFLRKPKLFQDVRLKKLWALNPKAGQILSEGEWVLRGLPKGDLEEVADKNSSAAENVRQRAKAILKEQKARDKRR